MYHHIYQIIMKNLSNISAKNIYFNFFKRLKNLHCLLIVLLYFHGNITQLMNILMNKLIDTVMHQVMLHQKLKSI
jgi:hypothetical protein